MHVGCSSPSRNRRVRLLTSLSDLFVSSLQNRPCNPALTVPELTQHLKLSGTSLIIAHTDVLATACSAAQNAGISRDRIIVIPDQDIPTPSIPPGFVGLDDVVSVGLASGARLIGRKLNPGEGKTKIAFYSSSSGTTGPPKVRDILWLCFASGSNMFQIVKISHYAFIANILQISSLNKISEPYDEWDKLRYRPGDACLAILPFCRK